MEGNVVLTMRDISKTFPGVKALQHVDFTLRKGEIHALMGENGAGKSTLIKVLTGVHEFENGEIRLDGKDGPIINKSPQDAQNNGISTVYQEVKAAYDLNITCIQAGVYCQLYLPFFQITRTFFFPPKWH